MFTFRKLSIILFLSLAVITHFIYGCDSGESNPNTRTVINGVIDDLIISGAPKNKTSDSKYPFSIISRLKKELTFTKNAFAQVPGITVIARLNGLEVDRDTTNSEGEFTLRLPDGGTYTLEFVVAGGAPFSTTLVIDVTPNSTVELVVDILDSIMATNPPTPAIVVIETFRITSSGIVCRGKDYDLVIPALDSIIIDGNGNNSCIDIMDFCDFSLVVGGKVTIRDCNNGILANDFGCLVITSTDDDIDIIAGSNGIRTTGDSDVTITGDRITVSGNTSINASGDSTQDLNPTPTDNCVLTGEVIIEDSAAADLADCTIVLL